MDNEFKVSWIDTNPQNSSYKNEYFAKNKISKKYHLKILKINMNNVLKKVILIF